VLLIVWTILGVAAGFVVSKFINKTGEGLLRDIGIGIAGAVVAGWAFNNFGAAGATGLELYSLVVTVVGAFVFIVAYHTFFRVAR
jgi:uncharacterized membrane protein YeaQ/YmgE (transglycosylase-associated protein family)